LVTSEEHFALGREGAIYSSGPAGYEAWSRYLDHFDQVMVLGRAKKHPGQENYTQRVDGPCVFFAVLPDFTGPRQYFRMRRRARAIARRAIAACHAYLLRVPGLIAQMAWREVMRLNRPYAAEVLGDAWDALSPGSWPNISRPFFRLIASSQQKRICAGAMALRYAVSERSRKRYPASENAYVATFSDVMLGKAQPNANVVQQRHRRLRELPWQDSRGGSLFRLGFIGSFSRMYKGADVLLRAVALCRQRGLHFSLDLVGQGHYLAEMKSLAAALGLADCTHFPGQLPFGEPVFAFLDSIDLFVIASRAEGMPRALIEAMARGCPCVGTAVGAIPELLDSSDLVPAGNPDRLAESILQVACDSPRLVAMSERNITVAQRFKPEIIAQAQSSFLATVEHRSRRR